MRKIILSLFALAVLTSFDVEANEGIEANTTKNKIASYIEFYKSLDQWKSLMKPKPELKVEKVQINSKSVVQKIVTSKEQSANKLKTFEITAYTAFVESTGKTPSSPTFGITASGKKVKENYTASCPKSMPFGTKLYIPDLDNTYVCEDRGGAITEGHIDIYMKKVKDALKFGRQKLKVEVIKVDDL